MCERTFDFFFYLRCGGRDQGGSRLWPRRAIVRDSVGPRASLHAAVRRAKLGGRSERRRRVWNVRTSPIGVDL